MHDSLSAVWQQVTDLLSAGVSIIPVRDKQIGDKPPKTPYHQWKQYQTRRIELDELWHQMEEHATTAIAIICGEVSGNLEAIDIDVKNWPGIDAMLFETIRAHYPDLFARLRIHSTPSGGFHILYRVERPTGIGNQKLATASTSTQAGIETRGEGGYIVAPPSLGYGIHKDVPIPTITWEQRESLIALAKSFDEKIKVIAPPTVERKKEDYYDENPFEHYNNSAEGERILLDNGWTLEKSKSTSHRYYIRPGKTSGISASFLLSKRIFYIFSTSTHLEAEKGYHPATLLSLLRFNGDKASTYRYLVEQGYGKIKRTIERALVKTNILTGEQLPANISAEAKVLYLDGRTQLQAQYPHGVYWEISDKGAVTINREKLYHVADQLGFRLHNNKVVRIHGHLVKRITTRLFYDCLKAYIGTEEDTRNAYEAFLQRAGEFSISRITLLDADKLLQSTKDTAYKFFASDYLHITATAVTFHPYTELDGKLIWEEQLCARNFEWMEIDPIGLYYRFLELAIGLSPYLWRLIGYLTHEYKDESQAYIITLIEQCPDPKQGGGTGKNLFTNLIGHSTTLKNVAGAQAQLNEKFLQVWNGERVMAIHDLPKRFNFGFLKELSAGSGTLKKLFHDEESLPVGVMPKFVLSSNYSYDNSDGGLKRRLIPVEFSSFFTLCGGVDKYFGKLFPNDWTPWEWLQYDNLIVRSIQEYLKAGGKLEPNPLTEDGWLKQFDQMHMVLTREFIQQHQDYWLRTNFISLEQFRIDYSKFCSENNIDRKYALSSLRMSQALEDWCAHYKIVFINNAVKRELLDTIRGRIFELPSAPF